jgi:hypothetical protein
LVRRAVLWRKRSFGCTSGEGCRFVERILPVVQTCRLRRRNTLDYLSKAVLHFRNGLSLAIPPRYRMNSYHFSCQLYRDAFSVST